MPWGLHSVRCWFAPVLSVLPLPLPALLSQLGSLSDAREGPGSLRGGDTADNQPDSHPGELCLQAPSCHRKEEKAASRTQVVGIELKSGLCVF